MRNRREFLGAAGLAAVAGTACRRGRGETFASYAFVAVETGQAVAVVDLSAFATTKHIALDWRPAQIVTHLERPAVYAVGRDAGAIREIRSESLSRGRQIRLNGRPDMVRFSKDSSHLWALCGEDRKLVRIGLDSFREEKQCRLEAEAVDFDIGQTGSEADGIAAVSLGSTGRVVLVDLKTAAIKRTIDLGGNLGKVRFRLDGALLMAASLDDRQLAIYDMKRQKVTVRLPLAVRPDHFCMKADGGQLFITGEGMDALVTVYPYQTEVAGTMLAGRNPGFAAACSAPDYLFVTNPDSGDVTIVNIASQRVMAVAPVGKNPCFVAVTPGNEYALVLNKDSGDMAVLHVGTLSARRTKYAPLFTMIPVGSGPVSAVVRPA